MKKICKMAISLLVAVTLFSGCSSPASTENNQGNTGNENGNKVTKITFATWAGGEEYTEMSEIAKRVNESKGKEKNYNISIMSIPADYYTKLQSIFAAKSSDIDVMWLSQEYIPTYASLGGLQDLTELSNNDQQISYSQMYEGAQQAGKYVDKIYGVPWIINPVIVYYNKSLTAEAGYTEADYEKWAQGEWDLNDFKNVTKSISKDLDGDGELDQWGTYIWDWPPLNQWLWNFGGGYIDDKNNVIIDSKESKEGFQYVIDLLKEDASALPSAGSSNNGLTSFFQSGKLGLILAGSSDGVEVEGLPFEIGYAVVPRGMNGNHKTFPWIGVTAVSAFSKVDKAILYDAISDMSVEFFNWKVSSPIKGQEALYQTINPKKANMPIEVIQKSLEIASPGNLNKYAEVGSKVLGGTDGLNGVQQVIYNATTETDYKDALSKIDLDKAIADTKAAIESVLK